MHKTEREYNRKVVSEIEEICTTDPREFWPHIKKLGPRKCNTVPMKVYSENGDLTSDIGKVLNKYKQKFSSLLNNQDNYMFNEDFYNEGINRKIDKEKNMQEYNYTPNNSLIHQSPLKRSRNLLETLTIINQQVLTRFPMRS